jgi:hypothetical protein
MGWWFDDICRYGSLFDMYYFVGPVLQKMAMVSGILSDIFLNDFDARAVLHISWYYGSIYLMGD